MWDKIYKKSGIYKIVNIMTGDIYIGQAINFSIRITKHLWELKTNRHHSWRLQDAYNKFGKENFKFKILLLCESYELTRYEQLLVNKWKPFYNILTICGKSQFGFKKSEESKNSMKGSKNPMYGVHRYGELNPMYGVRRYGVLNPNYKNGNRCGYKTMQKNKKSSKFVGVSYRKRPNKWRAKITIKGKEFQIGLFETEIEAALAYNEYALEYLGWKANINNISIEEIKSIWE